MNVAGTTDTAKLDAGLAPILCADHAAEASGKSQTERHHLAGRRWNIVLDLTPNWHRIVSALQRMRKGVKHGNMAELLYGIGDLIYLIADYVSGMETETTNESKAKRQSGNPRPKPRRSPG